MDVNTVSSCNNKERFPENLTTVVLFGSQGCGKSCVINSLLGEQFVKEKTSTGAVTQQTQFISATRKNMPVLLIDTPGLDGHGSSFSKTKANLESNLESIDKVVIVIKNKRLEPTESKEIHDVLKYFNYENNPENFIFVINNDEEMQSKGTNEKDIVYMCMSLLDIGEYDFLGHNDNSNKSKVFCISNKSDSSFPAQVDILRDFICGIETTNKLAIKPSKEFKILWIIIIIIFMGLAAWTSIQRYQNDNGQQNILDGMSNMNDLQDQNGLKDIQNGIMKKESDIEIDDLRKHIEDDIKIEESLRTENKNNYENENENENEQLTQEKEENRKQILDLQDKVQSKEKENVQLTQEKEENRKQILDLQDKGLSKENENVQLTQEKEENRKQILDLQDKVQSKEKENVQLTQENEENRKQILDLQRKVKWEDTVIGWLKWMG